MSIFECITFVAIKLDDFAEVSEKNTVSLSQTMKVYLHSMLEYFPE